MHIHVIHENEAWLEPLARALDAEGLPWREWYAEKGLFRLAQEPPDGIFYNRMSASSHTRGHRYAAEFTASTLAWLAACGARIVNGPRALDLEISKVRQYAALGAAGIRTPRTTVVCGKDEVIDAARSDFAQIPWDRYRKWGGEEAPVILKPNRGGKGLGVRLFHTEEALGAYLDGPDYEAPVDGIYLLQEYIRAPTPIITRAEFIGGRFFYAVEVDTSEGFELCPADQCAVGDAFCPVGPDGADSPRAKFTIIDDIDAGLKAKYEAFLAANGIEVAGIEFIRDAEGTPYTYDVNTNTNYNPDAEARAGRSAMTALARFLGAELAKVAEQREAAE